MSDDMFDDDMEIFLAGFDALNAGKQDEFADSLKAVRDVVCDYCGWDLPLREIIGGKCPHCGAGGLG